jgi:DNA mismatch endonuclease (patch repair protein)
MGLRYRKHVKELAGKPDVVFARPRVVVFCDGDFWHGRNWADLSGKLSQGTNASYWTAKIKTNMERDERNTALLEAAGWMVLRFWEGDIRRDVSSAALRVHEAVKQRLESIAAGGSRRHNDEVPEHDGLH